MKFFFEQLWKILISLRLAVIYILGLALALTVATILESKYDTPTAQYLVYRSYWFYGLLTLFGLNILAVALSRLPWKKRHIPFLMAHAGILMVLAGSWLTHVRGIDGTVQISEGEITSAVEIDEHLFVFKKGEEVTTHPFPWRPAFVAKDFQAESFPEFGLKVERYLADAEPLIQFLPNADGAPAVKIKVLGSPMGGTPEFWLWAGDPSWATQKLGPARFLVRAENSETFPDVPGEARIELIVGKTEVRYVATSVRGEKKTGSFSLSSIERAKKDEPIMIQPGWRMPIQLMIEKVVLKAKNDTQYVASKPKAPGMPAGQPRPAVLVSLLHNPDSRLWLSLGDRADFTDPLGVPLTIGYYPRRIILPFGLRLKKFEMEFNPGTQDPAAYSSQVQVVQSLQKDEGAMDALPVHEITMNEPLDVQEYTFYQASYLPDFPRPVTTVLSVNLDPGRWLKYLGSLLLVLGAISLYFVKVMKKKRVTSS